MTLEEQLNLAARLNHHILMLQYYCVDGMALVNAMSDQRTDFEALRTTAGADGMAAIASQFPSLGRYAELVTPPRGVSAPVFTLPGPRDGQCKRHRKAGQLPFRLQRAAAILAEGSGPEAADAQAACGEVATRIVILEEALQAVLSGKEGAMEQARRAVAIDWS